MKRSRAVRLTLVASASSACASPAATPSQALHCVERGTNRVVADSLCEAVRVAANGGRTGSFGAASGSSGDFGGADGASDESRTFADPAHTYRSGPHISPFLWYYGGRVASGFASAGSYAPLEGTPYRSATGFATGSARRSFFGRPFGRSASSPGEAGHGGISRGGFGATGAAHGVGGHGS